MSMRQRFEIGTTYELKRNKSSQVKTIVDVYKTYNSKNELVDLRYVTEHDFLGQKMTDRHVTDTEIARALIGAGKEMPNFDMEE